jgi:ribose/xylose/arabinose/galactoside ABC-type transport system permease subunit
MPGDKSVKSRNVDTQSRSNFMDRYMLFVLLVAVFVVGAILSPTFLKRNNIQNVLLNISVYGLLAIGQTAVLLVKEIDLSCGALVAFAPMSAIYVTNSFFPLIQGGNFVARGTAFIIIFTLLVGTAVGAINGLVRTRLKISSLIATLGSMYIIGGFTYMFFNGHSLYLTGLPLFANFSMTKILNLPLPFLFFIFVSLLVAFLFTKTKIGRRIYATGGNEKAAMYSGISTARWKFIAFCFSGFCAGLAALIYCSRMQAVEVVQGSGYEMVAIAIAVIGGTTLEGGRGTILGTFIASGILCFILNIMSLKGLISWYQTVVIGIIIVGAALQHSYTNRKMNMR